MLRGGTQSQGLALEQQTAGPASQPQHLAAFLRLSDSSVQNLPLARRILSVGEEMIRLSYARLD